MKTSEVQWRFQRFCRWGRWGALLALAAAMLPVLGGCELFKGSSEEVSSDKPNTRTISGKRTPDYQTSARSFNQRVRLLDRVSARANILLTYFDEDGNERTEDPEGRLQVVRPNKLALSLGKAGQVIFWFGCDPEQYWWIDMSDRDKRIAAIGRHEFFDDATAVRIGLPIKPLDLIRLMGVVPMDISAKGATQWSDDGRLLGISGPIGDRGFQRAWVDPVTFVPKIIEIFDRNRDKVLVAEHEGDEPVEFTRSIQGAQLEGVRMPSRILITHLETQTTARLTLTGVRDGPITDRAFDLKVLLDKYPVDRTIDLDSKRQPSAPKPAKTLPVPEPTSAPLPKGSTMSASPAASPGSGSGTAPKPAGASSNPK